MTMTLEVRMSSRACNKAHGHYLQLGGDATIRDLLDAREKYIEDFPSYSRRDIVFEPWKDWELLLKNPGQPYTSVKVVQKTPGVSELKYDNLEGTGKVPGYYGDDRMEIDVDAIPPGTKLKDVFDFVERLRDGTEQGHFHVDPDRTIVPRCTCDVCKGDD